MIHAVDLGSDRLGDRVHSLIIVEHPADVAAFGPVIAHRVAADIFDHPKGKRPRHSAVLQFLCDAPQRDAADAVLGFAQPPERPSLGTGTKLSLTVDTESVS